MDETDLNQPSTNAPATEGAAHDETVFFSSLQTLLDRAGSSGFLPPGVPQQIGRYRLNRFIGGGGFGLVFEAENSILQRRVAIKLPKADLVAAPEMLKCFLAEARAAANLHHPGILNPLDADIIEYQPYIAYPYCPGPNLEQWILEQQGFIPARLAAEIVLSLVEAVAFSHEAGVLHRDIKPANILLFPAPDRSEEFPYRVTLTDFGLAKAATLDSQLSSTSILSGTVLYLAPEQVSRYAAAACTTDIYSIGVVLYELLTLKRPFESDNLLDLLKKISDDLPTKAVTLNRDIPHDLNAVCMKCLEKQPTHRYASATKLADDLRRFLQGQAVRAKPKTLPQRAVIWLRAPVRKRELGTVSIVLAVFVTLWTVVCFTALRLLGEIDFSVAYAFKNTLALTVTVAVPLALAGRGLSRGSRAAAVIGFVSSVNGAIVSLLAFSRYPIAFPELYGPNPIARTAVFTLLATAFLSLATMYAALLVTWDRKAN